MNGTVVYLPEESFIVTVRGDLKRFLKGELKQIEDWLSQCVLPAEAFAPTLLGDRAKRLTQILLANRLDGMEDEIEQRGVLGVVLFPLDKNATLILKKGSLSGFRISIQDMAGNCHEELTKSFEAFTGRTRPIKEAKVYYFPNSVNWVVEGKDSERFLYLAPLANTLTRLPAASIVAADDVARLVYEGWTQKKNMDIGAIGDVMVRISIEPDSVSDVISFQGSVIKYEAMRVEHIQDAPAANPRIELSLIPQKEVGATRLKLLAEIIIRWLELCEC